MVQWQQAPEWQEFSRFIAEQLEENAPYENYYSTFNGNSFPPDHVVLRNELKRNYRSGAAFVMTIAAKKLAGLNKDIEKLNIQIMELKDQAGES